MSTLAEQLAAKFGITPPEKVGGWVAPDYSKEAGSPTAQQKASGRPHKGGRHPAVASVASVVQAVQAVRAYEDPCVKRQREWVARNAAMAAAEIQGRFGAEAFPEVLAWVTSEASALWDEARAVPGRHEPYPEDLGLRLAGRGWQKHATPRILELRAEAVAVADKAYADQKVREANAAWTGAWGWAD
jgi:hypothetical protein